MLGYEQVIRKIIRMFTEKTQTTNMDQNANISSLEDKCDSAQKLLTQFKSYFREVEKERGC